MTDEPTLGVIGGSGVYHMAGIKNLRQIELDTPFGKPSSPIAIGELSGKSIAFLARHGLGHTISPRNVNYRANIYAFKQIGVKQIISISACGSLREDFAPGDIVIPNQLVDFTSRRERSFFSADAVVHVGVAEPFCETLAGTLADAVRAAGGKVHKGATLITIEGPRFSTRAESNLYRSWGISIIGMTACPEAFLAREAEICYATMAHVTDYDVWHITEEPVSVEIVIQTLTKNAELAQKTIANLIIEIKDNPACPCRHSLKNAIISQPAAISATTLENNQLLLGKYLNTK